MGVIMVIVGNVVEVEATGSGDGVASGDVLGICAVGGVAVDGGARRVRRWR